MGYLHFFKMKKLKEDLGTIFLSLADKVDKNKYGLNRLASDFAPYK